MLVHYFHVKKVYFLFLYAFVLCLCDNRTIWTELLRQKAKWGGSQLIRQNQNTGKDYGHLKKTINSETTSSSMDMAAGVLFPSMQVCSFFLTLPNSQSFNYRDTHIRFKFEVFMCNFKIIWMTTTCYKFSEENVSLCPSG